MELKLQKQPIFINEVLLDTTVEQPVECDALLPDHCPDIVRILEGTFTPTISGRRINGTRLELEGMTTIEVLYIADGGAMHKAEYKVPFARVMDMQGEGGQCAASVQARPGYVNCRAVNQRRLDIRGSVLLCAFVLGCREEQAISGGEGGGLQLREDSFGASRLLGQSSREIRLDETLELSYGKPPIGEIVRCCALPKITECKAADGKVAVKGELSVHLTYQHAGGCDQMDFTLPTAAVIELPGADEQCTPMASQELLLLNVEPAADDDGEFRAVRLEAAVLVTAKAECAYKASVCSDCYSTRYQCDFRSKNLRTLTLQSTQHEPVSVRETMQLPDNIESVLDLWCEVASLNYRCEQGSLMAEGRLVVSMLGRMHDGEIYYFDKNLDFSQRVQQCGGEPVVDGRMNVTGSGFSFSANDAIDLHCELMMDCSIYEPTRCVAVDEITVDEKKPRTDTPLPGLYLYMADESEPVWDIAKRYNTSVARIAEENPQHEGRMGGVLMIPVL